MNPRPIEVVLTVVDPDYPNIICVDTILDNERLFKSSLEFAEINGLYYCFIKNLFNLNLNVPFLNFDRWNEENEKLDKFKDTIKFLNEESDLSDWGGYVLIKAFNTVPNIPNDVDIFVRTDKRNIIIETLMNNGMKCIQSSVAETKLSGRFAKVDLYTEISYIGKEFIDADFLWKSQTIDNVLGVNYPALRNEADLLLTIIHGIFGHRCFTLLDFLHMKNLIKNCDLEFCRDYALRKGWGNVFDMVLNEIKIIEYNTYNSVDSNNTFPYLFEQKFILNCISNISNLELNKKNWIFIFVNLILDRTIHEIRGTQLYYFLKSHDSFSALINLIASFTKRMRGDSKSKNNKVREKN